jgi:two-component sensor histidine kinase
MRIPLQGLDPLLSEAIIGTISDPMIVLDQDLRVILASRAFYDKFQVKHKDTHDKLFYELGNGQWNIPKLRTLLEEVVPQKKAVDGYEVEHDFEHLGKRLMSINARQINYESGQKKMLLTIQDITEQRAYEEQKKELMHQKDTLLKEMRHRIANSLQLIASIILLKSGTVKSEETRLHLQDAHDRILSIATVQRNLDPSGDDSLVPVVEYLKTLCESIAKTMIGGRKPIILTVSGGTGTADPDEAISIGLITTELVINALKHAFPSGEGEVTITYESDTPSWKLSIGDNGIGLAATAKADSEGLGSSIIDSLAKQLKADVGRVSSSAGTTVSVSYPRMLAAAN